MLLVGDIGGTKTDLAVITPEAGPRAPLAFAEFPSASYTGLEAIVREFLGRVALPVTRACFGVAGSVIRGRVKTTNLPWVIEAEALAKAFGLESVRLLNDLEAIAWAVPLLRPDDLVLLNAAAPVTGGALAIIAPGTGLGEAFLTWDGSRYLAHASEGGHADFAPTNASQIGLLQYLHERHAHVSVERVCSGLGIPYIYDYLRDTHYAPESPDVSERLAHAADRTPIIVDAALHPTAPCKLSPLSTPSSSSSGRKQGTWRSRSSRRAACTWPAAFRCASSRYWPMAASCRRSSARGGSPSSLRRCRST